MRDTTGWSEFTDALKRCRRTSAKELRDQPSWQGHLLDLVGARQGQADTVHAINVQRLKPALEQTLAPGISTRAFQLSPEWRAIPLSGRCIKKLRG